jgi:cell division protein ZipA
MIERDTIILVLGLLVVGVFVRGLIVAVRARRNQLRFALEKNISDIEDPDDLNLAELPQGGARVVSKRKSDEEFSDENKKPTRSPANPDERVFLDKPETQGVSEFDLNDPEDELFSLVASDEGSEAEKHESNLTDPPEEEGEGFAFDFETPSTTSGFADDKQKDLNEATEENFSVSAEDRIGFSKAPDRSSKVAAAAIEFAGHGKSFFSRLRKERSHSLETDVGSDSASDSDSDSNLNLNLNSEGDDLLFSEYSNANDQIAAGDLRVKDEQHSRLAPKERDMESSVDATSCAEDKHVSKQPTEILVVNVMATEGRLIRGDELLNFFQAHALFYGEMNIFHKYVDDEFKNPSIFRVANMLNPGTFDLKKMGEFTTFGVSFFLSLPSCMNNFDAFEYMLLVAKNLQESLGAEMRDDQRNAMTEQTIEHYRQRVRDFELASLRAHGNSQ